MAIAFTVVAGAYGAGAVSGGCFNPAVALGIDVSSAFRGFGWSIAYVIFELLGAAMAAALFKVVRPEDFGGEKSQMTELVSEFLGTYMLVSGWHFGIILNVPPRFGREPTHQQLQVTSPYLS